MAVTFWTPRIGPIFFIFMQLSGKCGRIRGWRTTWSWKSWGICYFTSLPPANEVWGKVIFSQVCVRILFTGGEGACSGGGVSGLGRCLLPGGGWLIQGVPALGGAYSGGGGVPAAMGGVPVPGGACSRGCLLGGGAACYGRGEGLLLGRCLVETCPAGGTHPTGMHSCYYCYLCCISGRNQKQREASHVRAHASG